MSRPLKQILLQIARLPKCDQRWIIRQLPEKQRASFSRWQGLELLKTAARFRSLALGETAIREEPLPHCCHLLADACPLYAAIVLEQGSYPWQEHFLQQFDRENLIRTTLQSQVADIKTSIRQALFAEWEDALSFEACLEKTHG